MFLIKLLVLSGCLANVAIRANAEGIDLEFESPPKATTQGKVTLQYSVADQLVVHELSFNEAIDLTAQRYKVSIGYISYEPTVYYATKSGPAISAVNGQCKPVAHPSTLIPELSWFTDLMLPGVDLKAALAKNPFLVGPSGLIAAVLDLGNSSEAFEFVSRVTYRNIGCNMYRRTIEIPEKNLVIKATIHFLPTAESGSTLSQHSRVYSLTIAADDTTNVSHSNKTNLSFTVDMFENQMVGVDYRDIEMFEQDFTLPLVAGCSEHVVETRLYIESQTFSMLMRHWSAYREVQIAYDHAGGFLRKEIGGQAVSIWDINENMLYFINTNLSTYQISSNAPTKPCSFHRVDSESLPPAFRPYKTTGTALNVLEMIGATDMTYMGIGSARGIPCYIYETVLDKPPVIFSTAGELLSQHPYCDACSFIVQYYLIRGERIDYSKKVELNSSEFWPAQITLYHRDATNVDSPKLSFIDQLDIHDFHWSLDGWAKKSGELFMVSECFQDNRERRQLEISFKFGDIHDDLGDNESLVEFAMNKFRLEYELTNYVLDALKLSRIYMVAYELELQRHNLDLSMIVSDRRDEKNLELWGAWGNLDCTEAYQCVRINVVSSEEECVLAATLVSDSHFVAYCPGNRDTILTLSSGCYAFKGSETEVINMKPAGGTRSPCQMYAMRWAPQSSRLLVDLGASLAKLRNKVFEFTLPPIGKRAHPRTLPATVDHYDMSFEFNEYRLNRYKFVMDNKTMAAGTVRTLDTIKCESHGDCIKMCNLDTACRSYSYCPDRGVESCTLSTLDLDDKKVREQVIHSAPLYLTNSTQIMLAQNGTHYFLELTGKCNTYERNYMSLFDLSERTTVHIPELLARQVASTATVFACAKQAVEIEALGHHSPLFAYCAQTGSCLLDENLFSGSLGAGNSSGSGSAGADDELAEHEVPCIIYRRQYHTYFHVSVPVLAKNPEQQVELELGSVEECARACWHNFGQICASFDYCDSRAKCTINRQSVSTSGGGQALAAQPKLETVANCLHYERDLKWDELRREHLIGAHRLLQSSAHSADAGAGSEGPSVLVRALLYALVFAAFVVGLYSGGVLNDKLESVTILHQSVAAGSGMRFSRVFAASTFGFGRGGAGGDGRASEAIVEESDANVDVDEPSGSALDHIEMNVIGGGGGGAATEPDGAGAPDGVGAPGESGLALCDDTCDHIVNI